MDAMLSLLVPIIFLCAVLWFGWRLLGFQARSGRFSGVLLKLMKHRFGFNHAPIGRIISAQIPQQSGTPGNVPGRGTDYFPLARSVVIYFVVLIAWIILKVALFVTYSGMGSLPIFAVIHLTCGFVLNRTVLSQVIWHNHYNTLARVSRIKLLALILWPVTYPVLFFQFMTVRYL